MKNRLEVAKELLSDDGVIFVSIDDNEQAYLKVLMDEIFGRENFVANLVINSAPAGSQSSNNFAAQQSYALVFQKSLNFTTYNIPLSQNELNEKYKEFKDKNGEFYAERLWKRGAGGRKEDVPTLHFPVYFNKDTSEIYIDDEINDLPDKSNLIKIIPYHTKGVLGRWTWSKENMKDNKHMLIVKLVAGEYKLHKKMYKHDDKGKKPNTIIDASIGRTEIGSLEIKNLMGKKVFAYPKAETLLKYFIQIATNPNDIVLDYHVGSGTTCAVAHKMGRRWIGIEQMDYIEDITKVRLQKVLDGEQGGISKAVNWQGGGSFVYFELKKYNQYFIDKILQAQTMGDLDVVYNDMAKNAFFKFWFDKDDFQKQYKKDADDKQISLDDRKKILIDVLDENQLYLNYADMDDTRFNVSDDDKALSKAFYGA